MPYEIDLDSIQGLAVGFIIGLATMKFYQYHTDPDSDSEYTSTEDEDASFDSNDPNWEPPDDGVSDVNPEKTSGPVKMVIAVRTDLKMGKGKMCAQVGHGVLAAGIKCRKKHKNLYNRYKWNGQKKICVKVNSEDELYLVQAKAQSLGLIAEVIADAGHTQIAAGSRTVCAVGPGPESLINEVTGDLKLL